MQKYQMGLLTNEERYQQTIKIWAKASSDVTDAMMEHLGEFNPIFMMADSGARGSVNQIRQLAAMRGLMADTQGRTCLLYTSYHILNINQQLFIEYIEKR